MSVLTLIRHGQASFFADNYDQLSELGERQARALGEYWARRELKFDEVYTGPRVRQRHSAELAVAAARQAGQTCPDPAILQDLDEYDLKGLTRLFALAAPDRTALELHWRLRNASLTEFAFTRDRFTLDSFNAVPHLDDPALWSYR